MTTNENLVEVLNDLVQINNDRIEGYQKAAEETKDVDVDLKAVFLKMSEESMKYKKELVNEVSKIGGEPATGTTGLGKIHRAWMEVKATFSGKDRLSVLENCEFGEDASQKAYRDALASDAEMGADSRQLITSQQTSLKTSYDIIKKYRDMHKAVDA
ncbi:MAG: PA2169 family four-helix-bundle protein [Ferruginibacter sp.]|nr:PA2169 family four-helix-bundle protein [Ferruginibacter sp.]